MAGALCCFIHPTRSVVGRESFATGENRAQPVPARARQLAEEGVAVAVDVAEKREIERIRAGGAGHRPERHSDCLVVQDERSARSAACRIARTGSARCRVRRARARRSSSRAARAAPPRAPGSIGARTMKFDCGVIGASLEDFVSGRLVMRHGVHRVPQLRKRLSTSGGGRGFDCPAGDARRSQCHGL